jgi:hypothetical protein
MITPHLLLLITEMGFWRRSARISPMDRVRNERIREIMKVKMDIAEQIKKRQLHGTVM